MNEGPGAGNLIAGIFLLLFGLCITLLGGGCTLMVLTEFSSMAAEGSLFFLAISLVTLGGGLGLLYLALKLMRSGFG